MRSLLLPAAFVLITSFTSTSTALEALTNSPCAPQCGNVLDSTGPDDIVCQDADYTGTTQGTVFETCITCQLNSTYQDPTTKETDLQWGLFNLRYAISYCLFGWENPNATSTPCITSFACGPLENMFEFDSLSPNASTYSYCTLEDGVALPKCQACLGQQQNDFYLTNFVTALDAACEQQPTPGNIISLQGSLFSTTATNITSPSASATSTSNAKSGNLSLGAKVGIAVGGVVLVLGLLGFCIVWNGKRRRRAFLRKHQEQSGYANWFSQPQEPSQPNMTHAGESAGPFFDSPQSQRPLVSGMPWGGGLREDESPASAMGEKVYFSPYSSQYNSPVSATDQVQIIGREWPIDRKESAGTVEGIGRVRARSKEKRFPRLGDEDEGMGERIELQNVAPVLREPSRHGRSRSSGLTEEDAKRGDAV